MALYFAEGGDSTKVLGLTCRHVLFKTTEEANGDYVLPGAGAPRKNVQLHGNKAFKKLLDSIKMRIGGHGIMAEIYERQIAELKPTTTGDNEDDFAEANVELEVTQGLLKKANAATTRRSRRSGANRASVRSATSAPPQRSLSMSFRKDSPRNGALSSSTGPSSRRPLRATSLIWVRFDLSHSGSLG
jgi:hypothetical protein